MRKLRAELGESTSTNDARAPERDMSRKTLEQKIEAASKAYDTEFAGRRHDKCDPARIEGILKSVQSVVTALEADAARAQGPERRLLALAREKVAAFTRERDAILAARSGPPPSPTAKRLSDLASRAMLYQDLLQRARASQRMDLAMLTEAIEGLEAIERQMVEASAVETPSWAAGNVEVTRKALAAFRAQQRHVTESMTEGEDAKRLHFLRSVAADVKASAEAEQLGVSIAARRPARLRHIADALRLLATQLRVVPGSSEEEGPVLGAIAELVDIDRRLNESVRPDAPAILTALRGELVAIEALFREHFAGAPKEEENEAILRRIVIRAASVALQADDLASESDRPEVEAIRERARQVHLAMANAEASRRRP